YVGLQILQECGSAGRGMTMVEPNCQHIERVSCLHAIGEWSMKDLAVVVFARRIGRMTGRLAGEIAVSTVATLCATLALSAWLQRETPTPSAAPVPAGAGSGSVASASASEADGRPDRPYPALPRLAGPWREGFAFAGLPQAAAAMPPEAPQRSSHRA